MTIVEMCFAGHVGCVVDLSFSNGLAHETLFNVSEGCNGVGRVGGCCTS